MKQLTQTTWPDKKEITIESDGLLVKTKTIREDLEYRIKFADLGFDIIKKRVKTANIPFYCFILFDILYAGLLINSIIDKEPLSHQIMWSAALVFFSFITLGAFYNRNKDVVYLSGGQKVLELSGNKPDRDAVTFFIADIHQAMKVYFKDKYTQFDAEIPYETRLNQLRWLKEIKAITHEEYTELLVTAKPQSIIGFDYFGSEN